MSRIIRMEILKKLWVISIFACVMLFILIAFINAILSIKSFNSLAEETASELLDTYERFCRDDLDWDDTLIELYELAVLESSIPSSAALMEENSILARSCDYLLLNSYGDSDSSSTEEYLITLDHLTSKEISEIIYGLQSQLIYEINSDSMNAPGDVYSAGGVYELYTTSMVQVATLDGVEVQGLFSGRVAEPWKITSEPESGNPYTLYQNIEPQPNNLTVMTFMSGDYQIRTGGEYTEVKNLRSVLAADSRLSDIIGQISSGEKVSLTKFAHKYEKYYVFERNIYDRSYSVIIYMAFSPIGSCIHRFKVLIILILMTAFIGSMFLADSLAKRKISKAGGTYESLITPNHFS